MAKFNKYSGVLIKCNDEVLLCKRSPEKPLGDVWSIPSGHVENGESPLNGAIREFYEETNIKITENLEFIGFVDRYKKDKTKKGHMFVFLCETKNKQLPDLESAKDGFEHTKCRYFKKENLPKQKQNQDLIEIIENILD